MVMEFDPKNEHFNYECAQLVRSYNAIKHAHLIGDGQGFNMPHVAFCTHANNLMRFLPQEIESGDEKEKYIAMIRDQVLTLDLSARTAKFEEKLLFPRDYKRIMEIINEQLHTINLSLRWE
jgi:hypothetical protein